MASLSRAIHASGEEWEGCGSLPKRLEAVVVCRCCLTWLNTVDALLPLLQSCRSWYTAVQQQIAEGDVGAFLSMSCIEALSHQKAEQREAVLRELATCARSSLYLDFSLYSGPSILRDVAETTGREIFSQMPYACELIIDLEAWDLPLGGFVLDLCRLIARSGDYLGVLQLKGSVLHQRMRAFLASGCRVDSTFKPSRPGTPPSGNNNNNSNSNSSSSTSTVNSTEIEVDSSPVIHPALSPVPSQTALSDLSLPPLLSSPAIPGAAGSVPPQTPRGGTGRRGRSLPFCLPFLRQLSVEGFQLLEFFEAPQLEEHAVTLTSEALRKEGVQRSLEKRASRPGSSRAAQQGALRMPSHRYWGAETSFIHPCLVVRFTNLNGAHLRSVEVAGFVAPGIKRSIIRWVRRALASGPGPGRGGGLVTKGEKEDIDGEACTTGLDGGDGNLKCRECVTLEQRKTGRNAWSGCSRLPSLERLRMDDLTLLAFVSAPKLQHLEVTVSSSGEWPLVLAFLRLYGGALKQLIVWAEDLRPSWLSTSVYSGRPEGLARCRTPTEILVLISFLQRKASCIEAPAVAFRSRGPPPKVQSAYLLGLPALPHLTSLTCHTCLLNELSRSPHALPSLRHLDSWGDASCLVEFLQQKRQLQTMRVRGLSQADYGNWQEGISSDDNEVQSNAVLRMQSKSFRGRSSTASSLVHEAATLEEYKGPGALLKASLLCQRLRRVEVWHSLVLGRRH